MESLLNLMYIKLLTFIEKNERERMEAVSLIALKKIISKVDKKNEYDLDSFTGLLADECHIIVESDINEILDFLQDYEVYSDVDLLDLSSNEVEDLWMFINQLFFE